MFMLGLNCDCIRDLGWERFGNVVSHLLIAAKMFFCMGGGLTVVISVCLKTWRIFKLLYMGSLEQARVLLLSSQCFLGLCTGKKIRHPFICPWLVGQGEWVWLLP